MYPEENHSVGPPTEKTVQNVKRARAHSLWAGPVHIEWKFLTGNFFLVPRWQRMTTEFFNEGPVRWFRGYWLTGGLSVYRLIGERRNLRQDPAEWANNGLQERRGGR